jgi:hypothetical protein
MVTPLLLILTMALLEFVLAFGASLGVNRASQNAAHVAATAGNIVGADCLILQRIEEDITVPSRSANVLDVRIQRTALAGNQVYGEQRWNRAGSTECALADGRTIVVPYTLIQSGYPEAQRCVVLGGCPLLTPARTTVDNIGVVVRYRHDWVTPLNGALDLVGGSGSSGGGWTFQQRNIFRIEPVL